MTKKSPYLPDRKRIFCNRCRNETNHFLKAEHSRKFCEEEHGQLIYWEEEVSRFWICAGCDQGTLEICYTMSGMVDEEGNQIYDSSFFPKRKEITKKHFRKLPRKLDILYSEAIQAYNNKLLILCAAALRALIEGICVDKNIKGKNLASKIDAMTDILPENIVKNLHGFRFMGNEALHELNSPQKRDLLLAIEIIEDLMNFIYDLDYKSSQLAAKSRKNDENTIA